MISTWYGYGDVKDLVKRTASDKVLGDKAFNIAQDPKCDAYPCGLVSVVFLLFDERSSGGVPTGPSKSAIKSETLSNH